MYPLRWWIAAIVVGLAVTVVALPAHNASGILVGLGIMSCGFGEWINHRIRTEARYHGKLITYPRVNRPIGLALDGLGILFAAIALYRLVA